MAESFYANLFAKIGDKLRNASAGKAPKAESPDSPSTKKPSKNKSSKSKGMPIGGRSMVDLTPEIYREAVRARALKKRWVFVNGGVLALCVLLTSSIFASSLPGKLQLDSELQNNAQLQAALGDYQEVNVAVEQMGATQDKLNLAAGGDIDWARLISAMEQTLPSGTEISSIGINSTSNSTERGAAILISFVANSPLGYADTLKSVQSAEGVSNVQIGGMTSSGEDAYVFSATMNYDTSIRTNRFNSFVGVN